ncbi:MULTISPECIES: hypothetical protein [Hymenobacter]|uniref:Lipoprotein n=1 Tax=Hymenobacter mucosus TaxID=1411120 RepID=A0A238V4T8_9BACT|nr:MULTISPECIES: hypothetical protein [Hymenobacter]SNR29201.1 hypothetical protein SAMN06269173_101105 [Hymenobacter mucosus]
MKTRFFAGLLLLSFTSCQKDTIRDDNSVCASTSTVRKVTDLAGIIQFNQTEQRFAISRYVPGTIDAVDIGIVCELPKNLQQEGVRVQFSGTYREYTGKAKPQIGGQKYYYLELTEVKAN